jgi:hypothetical protein
LLPNAGTSLEPAPDLACAVTTADTTPEPEPSLEPLESPGEPDAADLAELHDWAAEQTARDFLDHSATFGLAELVEYQATFYRSWPTEAGAMIARTLDALALKIRLTDAGTPEEFDASAEILDAEARQQWEDIGFEQGKAAALAECARKHGGRLRSVHEGYPDD